VVAVVVAAGLLAAGALGWQAIVVLGVAVNANEVHKWAHRTTAENGRLVSALQRAGIVQSRAHHGGHHGGARDTRYCVVTPWLNPVLDRCGFWRGLERGIAAVTGIAPQVDAAVAARRERSVATAPSMDRRSPRPPACRRPVGRYAALFTTAWGSAPGRAADPISAAGA
jgi:ubiquitin-conjugating enzyme E2 variant